MKTFAEASERGLVEVITVAHAGMTTSEFEKIRSICRFCIDES